MTVLEMKDIQIKDSPIHYRSEYRAAALVLFTGQQEEEIPVVFSIEHTAIGAVNIAVNIQRPLNYPILPVIKALKAHIAEMHSGGKLPG
jgi:hypothetical protein